jgi:hypothetical protein
LLLDALKVENFEAFKLFAELVEDPSLFPRILSHLLQYYLSKFDDQFNVLLLLRGVYGPVNQFNSCSESIRILADQFPEATCSLLEALVAQHESTGNFLTKTLDPNTQDDQYNFHIKCMLNSKELLGLIGFKTLILNLFDEFNFEWTQICLNSERARLTESFDIFGLNLAKELVIQKNRNVFQCQDHVSNYNFYHNVLDYFDGKMGQNTSSFEQLKLEAFTQFSTDHNFASFVKSHVKEPQNLNHILIDLEIFRESSSGLRFVNDRDVGIFGSRKFHEILCDFNDYFVIPGNSELETLAKFLYQTTVVFAFSSQEQEDPASFKRIREMEPTVIQTSILAPNSRGQTFLHFLVETGLPSPMIIGFLDHLKVQFGLKFVVAILVLRNRNNGGFTFWSHAFTNSKISNPKELKFEGFLEQILIKLFYAKIDVGAFKNLANTAKLDLIFGRENFHEILQKVDGELELLDPCFSNYFGLEGFLDHLKENYEKEKTVELCGKLLSDPNRFDEFSWLIGKFFAGKLQETKRALLHFARIGEDREAAFFLFLEILIDQYKSGSDPEIVRSLLLQGPGSKKSFLYKISWYDKLWSVRSFERLFTQLTELKKHVPDNEFKEFLDYDDTYNWTFLHCIGTIDKFEIAFNFLHAEFGIDFLREFLSVEKDFFYITQSIPEFTKFLDFLSQKIDKDLIKKLLMRKQCYSKENFLLHFYKTYSEPGNSKDLLELFELIFTIFGDDSELFDDLFHTKSSKDKKTFLGKLKEDYEAHPVAVKYSSF